MRILFTFTFHICSHLMTHAMFIHQHASFANSHVFPISKMNVWQTLIVLRFSPSKLSIEETSTKQKKRETIIIDCTKILDNEVVLCNHLAFSSGLLIYIIIILLFYVEVKISHMRQLVLVSRCRYRYLVN